MWAEREACQRADKAAENTINCAQVLYRDRRLSQAALLMLAPAFSAITARAYKNVTSRQSLTVISHYAMWSCTATCIKCHNKLFSNCKVIISCWTFNILFWGCDTDCCYNKGAISSWLLPTEWKEMAALFSAFAHGFLCCCSLCLLPTSHLKQEKQSEETWGKNKESTKTWARV